MSTIIYIYISVSSHQTLEAGKDDDHDHFVARYSSS